MHFDPSTVAVALGYKTSAHDFDGSNTTLERPAARTARTDLEYNATAGKQRCK
jgi:hypothetical protein